MSISICRPQAVKCQARYDASSLAYKCAGGFEDPTNLGIDMKVDIEIDGGRPMSFSAYDTYVQCPAKYRLKYVVGVPEQPALYFSGGSAVHLVTAVLDHLLERGRPLDEAVAELDRLQDEVGLEIVEQMFDLQVLTEDPALHE